MVAPPRPPSSSSSLHCGSQTSPVLCNRGCSRHLRFFSLGAPLHPRNLSCLGPYCPPAVLPPTSPSWNSHVSNTSKSPWFVPGPMAGTPPGHGQPGAHLALALAAPMQENSHQQRSRDARYPPRTGAEQTLGFTPDISTGPREQPCHRRDPSAIPVPAAPSSGAGGRQERMAEQSCC